MESPAPELAAAELAEGGAMLKADQVLGSYKILDCLGAGGMGEVYRAKDTKLDRDVAIKVLPEVFSQDRERLVRFQREARLLASLNHPNIGAIYGLEESEGIRFLVLELVSGQTLAERLEKGRLSVDEALPVCRQIAEGLEAAHERGVIHRDLKPANVMVSSEGRVKILDFGLAKAFTGDMSSNEPANSPTVTGTREGVILGTAFYMSPEQARGKEVDRRTDIWAFGCVMYEVLTGSKVYEGQTVSDSIARILERDPDWDVLPSKLPPKVRDLLRRCLQKDLRRRLQAIGDARIEIEEVLADPGSEIQPPLSPATAPTWRRASILALVVGIMAGIAVWNLKPPLPEEPRRVAHFNITPQQTPLDIESYLQDVAISPDGTNIAYVGRGGARMQLYLSSVGQFDATSIRGTEGIFVTHPFFSPDGNEIAFIAGPPGELKKVPLRGGVPVTLALM